MSEGLVKFQGTPLMASEAEALGKIELGREEVKFQFLNQKPGFVLPQRKKHLMKTGFAIDKGHVVELCVPAGAWQHVVPFIRYFTNLQILDIFNADITEIPEWISRLRHLRVLILDHDQFETLPDSIGDLAELEELYILDGKLKSLPASITRLPRLRVVEIVGHPNLQFQPDILKGLRDMKTMEELRFQWESPKHRFHGEFDDEFYDEDDEGDEDSEYEDY
nr:leucine-rich repeat domain-containing protein [Candidatus Sigynarchaeota archaeon]